MDVFDKAREVGEMIVNSAEFARFKKAEENQVGSELAQALIAAYNEKRNVTAKKIQTENISKEEKDNLIKELNEEFEILSNNDIIREYIDARKSFDGFYKRVIDIINFSITGEDENGCDESKCSSCGGGCKH